MARLANNNRSQCDLVVDENSFQITKHGLSQKKIYSMKYFVNLLNLRHQLNLREDNYS